MNIIQKIKFKICLSQRKYGLQGQKYLQFSHLPGKFADPWCKAKQHEHTEGFITWIEAKTPGLDL